jgi:GNAT superfamily N-acetyltransferase
MNNLHFDHSYCDNHLKRKALIALFEMVFGISSDFLSCFYERGYWDPTYRPYSFFKGNKVVANVSMFDMPLVINGQNVKAAGIQSVMTYPSYQGKGLIRKLFVEIFSRYEHQYPLFFLYTQIPAMYQKFGFRVLSQYHFICEDVEKIGKQKPLMELDMHNEQDANMVRKMFDKRAPVSHVFGFRHHQNAFFFQVLSGDTKVKVAYAPTLDVVLVYNRSNTTLHLYDIIGSRIPNLHVITSCFDFDFSKVEIHFSPDLLEASEVKIVTNPHQRLMVRGDLPTEKYHFAIPSIAEF